MHPGMADMATHDGSNMNGAAFERSSALMLNAGPDQVCFGHAAEQLAGSQHLLENTRRPITAGKISTDARDRTVCFEAIHHYAS